ncbi:Putative ABC transporter anion-binding protein [Psilocybe cubensis]|uniref:ABC transporter anion-binding protein n=2 Tax=Psilocybe cubensis TaxID=181762 RepID=A0ACB8GMM4_PSICU|nr:Putative ABC transporter anion-binding protein [Psilocybe cubensis]KAH9476299.1 Putative ABC transporter anion-binding protein [Psilocybe cubensis]
MLFFDFLHDIFTRQRNSHTSFSELPDEKSSSHHNSHVYHVNTEANFTSALAPITRARPSAIYDGGYGEQAERRGVCLRIANGGAGQTGLIGAWADAFIRYMVSKKGVEPFQVAWYLGDTTESLAYLVAGDVDIAVTYNPAAESQVVRSGDATDIAYVFRDHFMLVGPPSNPAGLNDSDDIQTMFSKIVASGNADIAVPPRSRPPTRFLSRYDKSATNIKESLIFATIGQVPWALDYSKWYHQYPRFPKESLEAAADLSEYTLTDKGTWLDAAQCVTSQLKTFKIGSDNATDLLLNPAHALAGKRVSAANSDTCKAFMKWVTSANGGQKVIEQFEKHGQVLYSKAP